MPPVFMSHMLQSSTKHFQWVTRCAIFSMQHDGKHTATVDSAASASIVVRRYLRERARDGSLARKATSALYQAVRSMAAADDTKTAGLIADAMDGDRDADALLLRAADNGASSSAIARYIGNDRDRRKKNRGRPKRGNWDRDLTIVLAVYRARKCGLDLYRNRATEDHSACSRGCRSSLTARLDGRRAGLWKRSSRNIPAFSIRPRPKQFGYLFRTTP